VIGVQQWAEIRRLYFAQGWKKRAIARHLRVQRRTVDRALASEGPPRYQRTSRPSRLVQLPADAFRHSAARLDSGRGLHQRCESESRSMTKSPSEARQVSTPVDGLTA
jgi:hypothetical protein